MSKTTSINLGEHFQAFINRQVESGRFDSVSEVIRASLRLMEESEEKRAALRQALLDGENSGEAVAVSLEEIKAKARTRADQLGIHAKD